MKQKYLTCCKNNQVTWSCPRQLDNFSTLKPIIYDNISVIATEVLSIAPSNSFVIQNFHYEPLMQLYLLVLTKVPMVS